MMMNINEFLNNYINEEMHQIIVSGPRHSGGPSKVKIRPVILRDRLCYQATLTLGAKENHANYEKQELIAYLEELLPSFKQLQLTGVRDDATVLVGKKGTTTIKYRKHAPVCAGQPMEHNRRKQYLLQEGTAVPFLVDLGVMTTSGKVVKSHYDKFRQINRFLEFIEDILPRLPKDREIRIIDFGCGKSYLTFAMYYYLKELMGYEVCITGLDLKADVIEHCSQLAEKYGYDKLNFCQGDIASYQGAREVDMVVTLHACDTATDHALAKAVLWNAGVILSVPCCQHELNGQIANELLEPVLSYGILKERMAALITDGLRAKMLEEQGYQTQILEFIDMEHTPKNLLIRAVKTGKPGKADPGLKKCMEALHAEPSLERLLRQQEAVHGHEEDRD